MKRAKEIEKIINDSDTWDMEILKEMCDLAEMSNEWEEADGDNFESVVYKAAEKLGINI